MPLYAHARHMMKETLNAEESRKETTCEGREEKIQIMGERNNLSVADRYVMQLYKHEYII